jgi:hypothetical protein
VSMRARRWSPRPLALLAAGLLGASTALLASCGSSGKLIPVANSEPLQKDFEEVAQAAEGGHGSCESTEAALGRAERDFHSLPGSVDPGLRQRLGEGLSRLHAGALELCRQPLAQTTATTAPPTTTQATTTPTSTERTNTQATTTSTTQTSTNPNGGTAAKEEAEEGAEAKKPKGNGDGGAGAAGGVRPGGEGQ